MVGEYGLLVDPRPGLGGGQGGPNLGRRECSNGSATTRPSDADRCCHQGRWFSWGPENCTGIPSCWGDPVRVPGVGCAQGSWGSIGANKGVPSALASFGSPEYAAYLADAMANSWTRNLGIDGYTIDCAANYNFCMLQTKDAQGDFYKGIVGKVRETQPQQQSALARMQQSPTPVREVAPMQ